MIRLIKDFVENFNEGLEIGADLAYEKYPELENVVGSKENFVRICKIFYGTTFGLSALAIILIVVLGIKSVIKLFKKGA